MKKYNFGDILIVTPKGLNPKKAGLRAVVVGTNFLMTYDSYRQESIIIVFEADDSHMPQIISGKEYKIINAR